jgi:hypothetical protein
MCTQWKTELTLYIANVECFKEISKKLSNKRTENKMQKLIIKDCPQDPYDVYVLEILSDVVLW